VELHQPAVEDLDLTTILQALGDPVRLSIVRELAASGEQVCGSLALSVSKSTRSHHFKTLREAGLTERVVIGGQTYQRLRTREVEDVLPGVLSSVVAAARL
jgi:DNA-binding transcriptional ArsR family regulator